MKNLFSAFRFYKLKLYQQIMLLVFFLLIVVFSLDMFLVQKQMANIVNHRLGNNADIIADAIVQSRTVKKGLAMNPPDENLVTETVRGISKATKASIIIFDSRENIISIFNPSSESLLPAGTLSSDTITALRQLPVNIFKNQNAKPITGTKGETLGYVLVGFPEADGSELTSFLMNILVVASMIGLAFGLLGAFVLAYAVKKTLFGFEPLDIAHLLEERTTLLDTVNESIFVTDPNLNLRLLNSKALELVKKTGITLTPFPENESFRQLGDTELLTKVLATGESMRNVDMDINGLATVGDIILLRHEDKEVTGLLVSLNEKDSIQAMAERLSGVTNYADALRARTHEFMNKMHVIKGLLYTKNYDQLQEYVVSITDNDNAEVDEIKEKIKDPLLASFLIAKKSRAHELQVDFCISDETSYPEELSEFLNIHDMILVIGNLLENSFDILKEKNEDRSLLLEILPYDDEVVIIVSNNGKAIAPEAMDKIFQKGFTTKGKGHGFGLALVKERLDKLHGTISVDSDELNGTEFTVQIPLEGEI